MTSISGLPLTRNPAPTFRLAILVTVLMTLASLAGLFIPAVAYPGEELRNAFLPNDIVNLVIGLPVLAGALWLIRRGKLAGLLGLPGALFYVAYNSVACAAAMPFTWFFPVHLILAGLSAYTVFRLLSSMDGDAVRLRLKGRVPERFSALVLMGFGVLFLLRTVMEFISGSPTAAERGVLVADGLTTPLWILSSLYLWRKKPLGYISAAGLLFQASMLFIGLLAFFILQPLVADVSFPMDDFIVILAMSMVVFIPLGLFLRGIMQAGNI